MILPATWLPVVYDAPMSRTLITRVIQQSAAVTDEAAKRASGDLIDAIARELWETGEFTLPSFGTFKFNRQQTGDDSGTFREVVTPAMPSRRLRLSMREMEILRLVTLGHSNKMIAHELQMSGATVKIHVRNLLRKSRTANRSQLALWAAPQPAEAEEVADVDQHPQGTVPHLEHATDIDRALVAILSRWEIPDDQAGTILGSEEPSFMAGLRSGTRRLDTRDMRDRAKLLLDIYEGIYCLLQNPEAERGWIRASRGDLDGQSVLDLMIEGSQRNLIRALAFVDYVNGR